MQKYPLFPVLQYPNPTFTPRQRVNESFSPLIPALTTKIGGVVGGIKEKRGEKYLKKYLNIAQTPSF